MNAFTYFQSTEIQFGRGRVVEVGAAVARYGKRCLVVTMPNSDYMAPLIDRIRASLTAAGVEMAHFDGVVPNPTTDCVTAGADMAKAFGADVVLGVGGGSGTITGTVLGGIFLAMIYNAFNMSGINTYWQDVAIGVMLLAAVFLGEYLKRRRIART